MERTKRCLGFCVYEREGMISIYSLEYTFEVQPDGSVMSKLIPCSGRELRFPYDVRHASPTEQDLLNILQTHGKADFFEKA